MGDITEQKINKIIKEGIEEHVNGKLDRLDSKVDSKFALLNNKIETMQEKIKPAVQMWNSGVRIGNGIKWLAVLLGAVGVIVATFKGWLGDLMTWVIEK